MTTENEKEQPQKAYGLLAEYKNTTELVNAATKVRDAGYTKWDCYSPFPVHGIDPAMGIKATKTPWLILMMGITGLTVGLIMQYYMNAYDYKYLISGKPFFSLPANVPVMFELTVLFSGLTAIFGTLAINNLPSFYHPLFKVKEFARATDDRYFVAIEAGDNRYDLDRTKAFLIETGAATVQEVEDDSEVNAGLPMPIIYIGLCAFVIGFIPLSHIFNARFAKMDTPRIHPNPGMDFQPKFKAQTENDLFADGRSMRAPIEGTVRIGEERIDDHFYEGVIDGEWAETFPKQVEITPAFVERGQQRYEIFCSNCHGSAGYGDGLVARRADRLEQGTWVAPSNIHQDYIRQQPSGKLFNTISYGIRNMMGYGHSISEEDRWAIVAYIRALHKSQYAQLAAPAAAPEQDAQ